MAATPTLLTVEESAKLPWEDRVKRELPRGEVVEKPVARFVHELVKSNTAEVLVEWSVRTSSGKVFPSQSSSLRQTRHISPEVSWLSKQRIATTDLGRIAEGAPDFGYRSRLLRIRGLSGI